MPEIPFQASNFPLHLGVPNTGALRFNWPELVWAATSVGKAERFDMHRHGLYSSFEMVFREALLYANLKERPDGKLERSAVYSGLDPSEKGAISYFLGMTATKLFCEHMLSVPWLMHLDVYRDRFDIEIEGKVRPDFFGQNLAQQWIVIESKGRTNNLDSLVLEKAKQQSLALTEIDGNRPVLHAASVAFFKHGSLQIALDDPENTESQKFDLRVKDEEFLEGYYRPIRKWIEDRHHRTTTYRNQNILVVDNFSTGVSIGLIDDQTEPTERRELFESEHADRSEEFRYLGRDGIYVELTHAWSQANMRQEPQTRTE